MLGPAEVEEGVEAGAVWAFKRRVNKFAELEVGVEAEVGGAGS